MKPPVLYFPDSKGRFHLYLDTSIFATGSTLHQIQNGKPKLIAYANKRLPEAARNYSITELQMCGLAINISSFAHLLKRLDFDAIVDHLALMHIIKNKGKLTTTRMKRLLKILSSYSFNLYYIKGKDMVLSILCRFLILFIIKQLVDSLEQNISCNKTSFHPTNSWTSSGLREN